MTLRKFDDGTNEEIPLTGGVQVVVTVADGTSKTSDFLGWDHVPKRLLDGTVGGLQVMKIEIRDLTVSPPVPLSVADRRAASDGAVPA